MRLQNVERISSRNQSVRLVLLGLAAVVASACGSPTSHSPLQDTFDAAWQTAQSRSLAPGVIAVYFHPEHDGTIVTFFNKLDVRDEAMIALDLAAFSVFFVELSRAVFPGTYPDLGDPDDLWPGDAR